MTADLHNVYAELAAGYALSALEPQDEQLFLLHLAACPACAHAVAEMSWVTEEMAYAAPDAEPPASVLAGIRAGMADAGRPTSVTPVVAAAAPSSEPQAVVLALRRRPVPPAAWIGIAAALVLVVTLGVSNVVLRSDRNSAQESSVRLRSTVSQIVSSRTVQLRAPDGTVRGVALMHDNTVSLVLDGVARNDTKTSVYVLWRRTRYGATTAVGVFDVQDNKVDQVPPLALLDASSVTTLAITLERGRVAPPTGTAPMVAAGQVA